MNRLPVWVVLSTLPVLQAQSIRRLDGSHISIAEADAFARKTLAANNVKGAQIAVLDRGKLVWSVGYGVRREPDLPMQSDTNIWAASLTKSVFATYVMLLVEHGEFDLDKPISRQLPKPLDSYEPYQRTAAALVREPGWPAITARMLLSHSSGLANFAFIEPDKQMHLHSTPGSQYRYSGEGLNLLQFVIEQQRHASLDVLMRDAIFEPLGMTRTGLTYSAEFESNVADRFDEKGKFRSQTRRFPARAAGSMATTVNDFSRWVSALFSRSLLKESSRRLLFTPVLPLRSLHQFPLRLNEGEGAEAAQVGLAYGLGFGLLTHTKFGPAFLKEGHGDGAQNYFICFERRQACMIILTNSDNGELAFRALLETILGDTVTPWEWEGYTRSYIEESRRTQAN
jgi:CubicO group peptidase (beta-lactamase class C family)